jgi:predicted Zn finger-like uncharacterized protein
MPLSLSCPSCQKPYNVPDTLAGKQVRCQKCSHVFVAAAPPALEPLLAADLPPLETAGVSLADASLASSNSPLGSLTASPEGTPHSTAGNPLGYAPICVGSFAPSYGGPQAPPLEGPTDSQMRWGSAGSLALGVALAGLCLLTHVLDVGIYLWPLFIAPLLVLLGIAGLIDPNITRAVGKYGKHLPLHYKLIAWGLMGVWIVIVALLVIVMVNLGFRTGR